MRIALGNVDFSDERGGADELIERVFTIRCRGVIGFELHVSGEGTPDIAVLLMDQCERGESDAFRRIRTGRGDELIDGERGALHVRRERVTGQLEEDHGVRAHFLGLDDELSAVLADEIEQDLFVVLLDGGADECLEPGDDPHFRGGEILLVPNRDF